MLDYAKLHESPPDVQDPVSGDMFPASYSDLVAKRQAEQEQKQSAQSDAQMAAMLTSIFK